MSSVSARVARIVVAAAGHQPARRAAPLYGSRLSCHRDCALFINKV